MNAPRVLVVEDEPVTRLMLEGRLRAAGYAVQSAPSGESALSLLAGGGFALLLTDLYLEVMDGVDLMARARAVDPDLKMIILTGGATVDSAIAAMDHGAHAYLRKPVAPGELERRVAEALERRQTEQERAMKLRQVTAVLIQIAEPQRPGYTASPFEEPPIRIGPLEIEPARRRVTVAGRPIELSSAQYKLLTVLARRPNVVHSPEQLAREVCGYNCATDEARELIKSSVHRLRSKIEVDPKAPTLLLSVRGAGYMLSSGD